MPPTEAALLTTLLLHPAPLTTALPPDAFAGCFPPSWRRHPHVAHLYRHLQHRRALALDQVRENIEIEARRGEGMRRDVARQAQRDAEGKGEAAVEREWEDWEVEGADGDGTPAAKLAASSKPYTLETVVPALERACKDLETEIATLEAESQKSVDELNSIVGDLSDLRYGRFPKNADGRDLSDEAIDALRDLHRVMAKGAT